MIGDPTLVRYSVCLMARTSGSSAACASERHHRVVRVVGMLQQQVALFQHREEIGVLRVGEHVDRLRAADRAAPRAPADRSGPSTTRKSSGPGTT